MFDPSTMSRKGPARFRDPFDPEPWAARARRFAPRLERDEAVLERLRLSLRQGDPDADALVEWMHEKGMKDGRRLFERAVEHGIESVPEADPPLRHFFSSVDPVPVWL